jgi:hypothetical protein
LNTPHALLIIVPVSHSGNAHVKRLLFIPSSLRADNHTTVTIHVNTLFHTYNFCKFTNPDKDGILPVKRLLLIRKSVSAVLDHKVLIFPTKLLLLISKILNPAIVLISGIAPTSFGEPFILSVVSPVRLDSELGMVPDILVASILIDVTLFEVTVTLLHVPTFGLVPRLVLAVHPDQLVLVYRSIRLSHSRGETVRAGSSQTAYALPRTENDDAPQV